jgi:hypothetical protein
VAREALGEVLDGRVFDGERRRRGPGRRAGDHGASATVGLVALGFVGGLAAGAVAWSHLLEGSRRGLFSASPVRRYAAVSYLGARPSVDTARLLRDYVRWESQPLLRRRARRVLAAVEASLGR